ncbi:glycosyltransferase family 4 protein [Candidatus Microgenomates bacterium]|nr:glycosyltransferase family 4 protein [Candidatus Microgenomates bacterium]
MKIGIDISALVYGTGVSIYTKELVTNLLKLDSQNQYLLFGGSLRRLEELKSFSKSLTSKHDDKLFNIPPTLADILWNVLRFPKVESLTGQLDVFHSSDWTQPPTNAFKITTVHDLAPLRYPRETHPTIVAVHRRRLDIIKKEVDRVIVPSLATKKDLIDFGIKEERIRVIPEAASIIHERSTDEEIQKVKTKYKIDSNYLVTIGVGQRKNTQRLIEAFEKATAGQNLKLVLIGRSIQNFKENRGVRFTGHVTDQEFAALVSGAQVMVYPSLYEGFGLPILEAFNAQVPVVTSNVSSMPEVANDAAVLVDPYEVDSIAQGIMKSLKTQKTLKEMVTKQKGKYSWERTAQMTLEVYAESLK